MRPDSIFTCIKAYKGKNNDGKPIRLHEGKDYMRTIVDFKAMGHSTKETSYYLHDWERPALSKIELSPEEFQELSEEHLSNPRPM